MLARIFIGGLLTGVATVILVTFTLLVRSAQEKLESFGLNTLVIREMIPAHDPELFYSADRPDRLRPLNAAGLKLRLRQLFARAQTDWQADLVVLSYSSEALPVVARWLSRDSPLVCFSETVPEFIQIEVRLQHQSGVAVVRRPPELFRPLGIENCLLAPRGWAPDAERMGFVEINLFQRRPQALPMARYVEAVSLLFAMDRRPAPQMQSPLPWVRELERLQWKQLQWRRWLAGGLGFAIALVFGAIAVLEFRQHLYVGALLRSLGAAGRFLYFRQWIENALIANVSAALVMVTIFLSHRALFGAFGFAGSVLELGRDNPYLSSEVGLIFATINIGAFLSSLPVAVGLRKPVGAVLN